MKKLLLVLALSSVSFVNVQAAECVAKAPRGTLWKECLNARPNSAVDQYMLDNAGDLYSYIGSIGRVCQVTTRVSNLKISMHPMDAAIMYFEKDGNLYDANETRVMGQCPKVKTKMIMANVEKYSVVGNSNTTVVNMALSRGGDFIAWDNINPVYKDTMVTDYLVNSSNYGVRGAPFSSYVAFTLGSDHMITKVKGHAQNGTLVKASDDRGYYNSIQEFKAKNHIR